MWRSQRRNPGVELEPFVQLLDIWRARQDESGHWEEHLLTF